MSRKVFVDELLMRGLLPGERTQEVLAKINSPTFMSFIDKLDLDRDGVLAARCAAWGLPPAPRAWLLAPPLKKGAHWNVKTFRNLTAVPVSDGPPLAVLFADPEVAQAKETQAALPPHTAYLVDVREVLRLQGVLLGTKTDDSGPVLSVKEEDIEGALSTLDDTSTSAPSSAPADHTPARPTAAAVIDDLEGGWLRVKGGSAVANSGDAPATVMATAAQQRDADILPIVAKVAPTVPESVLTASRRAANRAEISQEDPAAPSVSDIAKDSGLLDLADLARALEEDKKKEAAQDPFAASSGDVLGTPLHKRPPNLPPAPVTGAMAPIAQQQVITAEGGPEKAEQAEDAALKSTSKIDVQQVLAAERAQQLADDESKATVKLDLAQLAAAEQSAELKATTKIDPQKLVAEAKELERQQQQQKAPASSEAPITTPPSDPAMPKFGEQQKVAPAAPESPHTMQMTPVEKSTGITRPVPSVASPMTVPITPVKREELRRAIEEEANAFAAADASKPVERPRPKFGGDVKAEANEQPSVTREQEKQPEQKAAPPAPPAPPAEARVEPPAAAPPAEARVEPAPPPAPPPATPAPEARTLPPLPSSLAPESKPVEPPAATAPPPPTTPTPEPPRDATVPLPAAAQEPRPPPEEVPSPPTLQTVVGTSMSQQGAAVPAPAAAAAASPPPPAPAPPAEERPIVEMITKHEEDVSGFARGIPSQIGRYKLGKLLGQGGMAAVFLAKDEITGKECALKLLNPGVVNAVTLERFKREAKAGVDLRHENVVAIYDAGAEAGHHYIACEYVEGGTVRDLMGRIGPFPPLLAVKIIVQVLDGLGAAHARGIIHRDLKPANLMLTPGGVVKLGDFGVAKAHDDETLTQAGVVFGTPSYMSPEQALGEKIDTRSDLFAVGTLFYQLLTGVNPFAHDNLSTSLLMVAKADVQDVCERLPTLPEILGDVMWKLHAPDRLDRYQTTHEVRAALRPLLDLVDQFWPAVIRDAMKRPIEVREELYMQQARCEQARARVCMREKPPRKLEAAWALRRSLELDRGDTRVHALLKRLCQQEMLTFGLPDDEGLKNALLQLKPRDMQNPMVLRKLATASLEQGCIEHAVRLLRAFVRNDEMGESAVVAKLHSLVGEDPVTPFRHLASVGKSEGGSSGPADTGATPAMAPAAVAQAIAAVAAANPPAPASSSASFSAPPSSDPGFEALDAMVKAPPRRLVAIDQVPDRSTAMPVANLVETRPRPAQNTQQMQALQQQQQKPPWGMVAIGAIVLVVATVGITKMVSGPSGNSGNGKPPPVAVADEVRQKEQLEKAQKAYVSGNVSAALDEVAVAIAIDKGTAVAAEAYLLQGKAHQAAGNLAEARHAYEVAMVHPAAPPKVKTEASSLRFLLPQ